MILPVMIKRKEDVDVPDNEIINACITLLEKSKKGDYIDSIKGCWMKQAFISWGNVGNLKEGERATEEDKELIKVIEYLRKIAYSYHR